MSIILSHIKIVKKISSFINNGKRTEWSPIRSEILGVININNIGRPRSGGPICFIRSIITDRIGLHSFLLPINQNHYNFQKKKYIPFCERAFNFNANYPKLVKYHWRRHCLMLQICPFWKILSSVGLVVVAMVIVMNSLIGGFSRAHLRLWLSSSSSSSSSSS